MCLAGGLKLRAGLAQATGLLRIVLEDVRRRLSAHGAGRGQIKSVPPTLALLWMLVDMRRVAGFAALPAEPAARAAANHVRFIDMATRTPNIAFYDSMRAALEGLAWGRGVLKTPRLTPRLASTSAQGGSIPMVVDGPDTATAKREPLTTGPPIGPTTKTVVAMAFAVMLRPLAELKAAVGGADAAGAQFTSRVLSLPLLSSLLQKLGLDRLTSKLSAVSLWTPLMMATTRSLASDSDAKSTNKTGTLLAYLQGSDQSSDSRVSGGGGAVGDVKRVVEIRQISRAAWAVGNILEMASAGVLASSTAGPAQKGRTLTAIDALLRALPGDIGVAPRASAQGDEPVAGLQRQLANLQRKPVLSAICECVEASDGAASAAAYRLVSLLASRFPAIRTETLNALVFSSNIIQGLHRTLTRGGEVFARAPKDWSVAARETVRLFCVCYNHLLVIQDDEEFFEKQQPCTLRQVTALVGTLKALLQYLYWDAADPKGHAPLPSEWASLRDAASETFRQLRVRQSRRQFCDPNVWIMKLPVLGSAPQQGPRVKRLLRDIPFVLTFSQRVQILYQFIREDRKRLDGAGVNFGRGTGFGVRVRRGRVLRDGFEALASIGANIKGRIQVQFINQHGMTETGIDGGGLFKEFVTELLREAFDPQIGLFRQTPRQFTYPNPSSYAIPNFSDHLAMFQFVGLIVGKCLYDGIILEPQFANFFLRKLLGFRNFVDDLASLDPEIYKNLLYIKKNSANGLGLTFSVSRDVLGESQEVDLVPGGADVAVTDENKVRFVYQLADFKLNREIAAQSNAFTRGLHYIIKREWLRMFEAEELDRLISGTPAIDVKDLRANTNYTNGYDGNHELIRWFWDILDRDFDEKDRRAFLKFSTSVSRSPLMGFRHLYPKFCIQRTSGDSDNLPTSATCMNLLKLPRYSSRQKLKEKLLYAIKSSSGFYLS